VSHDLVLDACCPQAQEAPPPHGGSQGRNLIEGCLASPPDDGSGVVGARGKRQDVTRRRRIARFLDRLGWLCFQHPPVDYGALEAYLDRMAGLDA
jgi:hypothetical protein